MVAPKVKGAAYHCVTDKYWSLLAILGCSYLPLVSVTKWYYKTGLATKIRAPRGCCVKQSKLEYECMFEDTIICNLAS